MLQWFSHHSGLRSLATLLFDCYPGRLRDGDPSTPEKLAERLTEICLDPFFTSLVTLGTWNERLRTFATDWRERQAPAATTELGAKVNDALDYALEQRCLVLIEGLARTGKTFAAQHWCAQRPGQARYVQVPSSNDELSFLIALARGLGLTVESRPKAKALRPRIEDTLQRGDLLLVLDEGHYLWPAHSYRAARPARICWLLTALVNHKVPLAILVTPQFCRSQAMSEKKTGWASEQLIGRIADYVQLPNAISMVDLRAVAHALLPEGDAKSIEALALYADNSRKYLAAIDHAVKKARHLAKQRGRKEASQADVRAAIETSGLMPAESALIKALRGADAGNSRGKRGTPARPVNRLSTDLSGPSSRDIGEGLQTVPV